MTHLISSPKKVAKKWGEEIWIVNNEKYCGKYLIINKGACSSLHYHPKKMESFMCIQGLVLLYVQQGEELKSYRMEKNDCVITLMPGTPHAFQGLTEGATLLEISTTHNDEDVVRLTESTGG